MPTLTGCGASLLRTPPLLFPFYYHESRVMLWESGILPIQTSNTTTLLAITPSVSNYRSFELFDLKFDHSSYSKICAKYHFFCCGLLYQYKFFKNDLNLTIFAQFFLNKTSGQNQSQKGQTNYNLEWMQYILCGCSRPLH